MSSAEAGEVLVAQLEQAVEYHAEVAAGLEAAEAPDQDHFHLGWPLYPQKGYLCHVLTLEGLVTVLRESGRRHAKGQSGHRAIQARGARLGFRFRTWCKAKINTGY